MLGVSAAAVAAFVMSASAAYADVSVSVQSLSPGDTVSEGTAVSFNIVPSGFAATSYQIADSNGTSSTITQANIDTYGKFFWTPSVNDVGTHTLTLTASDFNSHTAQTTQTITVLPPPSLSVTSLSPSSATVMPGTPVSFTVTATGFTNPSFYISDAFNNGTSLDNSHINSSGNFTWTPDQSQNGTHIVTIYANDSLGHSGQVSQTIKVGAGNTLTIQNMTPGTSVQVGQTLSFSTYASGFSPTAFSITDTFPNTTLTSTNINTNGFLSWTPSSTDIGTHVITVMGVVGAYGDSATTSATVTVYGIGGTPPPATPALGTTTPPAPPVSGSVSDLQAKLQALLAQISALGGASASTGSASSGIQFTESLSLGMQDTQVTQLQTVLAQQGYFSGTPSGHFGSVTQAAVMKFQAAHGLSQVGIVGPATRAALNALASGTTSTTPPSYNPSASTSASASASGTSDGYVFNNFIGYGDSSNDVTELQKRLVALGFLSATPSGYFGSLTEAAVKAFQAAHTLDQKGYVGPGTRAALNGQ